MKSELSAINKEKAVLVYMMLAKRYKDKRENIKYGVFSKQWDEMFDCDANGQARDMKIQAFKIMKNNFDDKTIEEIKAYRDTLLIYNSKEVPEDIKEMAKEKDVVVSLATNRDRYLSGFDIFVVEGKHQIFRITNVPFGLNEKDLRKLLIRIPKKEELQEKEHKLMGKLSGIGAFNNKQLAKIVNQYNAPYATHEFKVFMNKFTIHKCKNKELTNACVNLCHRVGIRNLSNNGYILYKYCEGNGQRQKNLKRIRKIRKNNEKAKK